jgi:hypothetical protein
MRASRVFTREMFMFGLNQLRAALTPKGIGDDQNFESESSAQDCQALRKKFNTDVLERAWISSAFKCTDCGRQLSIVDLFNSEGMAHPPEMIKSIWESSNAPPSMRGTGRTTRLTCDCGHTGTYELPEFAVKLKKPNVFHPIVFAYTRSGGCYH